MLKYLAVFYIISIGDSDQFARQVGHYHELIFAQRWPIAALFDQHEILQYENTNSSDIKRHLREHMTVFTMKNWFIFGLWPIKYYGTPPVFCQDYSGRQLIYNAESLNETFKLELKAKWPVLYLNQTEDDLWLNQYNTYGSCISSSTLQYFVNAIRLLEVYNIGVIFERFGIIPGNSYTIHHIACIITAALEVQPYIMCLPAQNHQEQYISEVHICFNRQQYLISCHYPNDDLCDVNKKIIYRKP